MRKESEGEYMVMNSVKGGLGQEEQALRRRKSSDTCRESSPGPEPAEELAGAESSSGGMVSEGSGNTRCAEG